jgi:hypothetical protein
VVNLGGNQEDGHTVWSRLSTSSRFVLWGVRYLQDGTTGQQTSPRSTDGKRRARQERATDVSIEEIKGVDHAWRKEAAELADHRAPLILRTWYIPCEERSHHSTRSAGNTDSRLTSTAEYPLIHFHTRPYSILSHLTTQRLRGQENIILPFCSYLYNCSLH